MLDQHLSADPSIEPRPTLTADVLATLDATESNRHGTTSARPWVAGRSRLRAAVTLGTAAAVVMSGLAFVGGLLLGQRQTPLGDSVPAVCTASPLPEMPRLVAVKVHADWCARCPTVAPLFEELEERHATEPVLFLTLDITDDQARAQSRYLLSSLGIEWIAEPRFESGRITLLDRHAGEVLASLTTPDQFPNMESTLASALDAD